MSDVDGAVYSCETTIEIGVSDYVEEPTVISIEILSVVSDIADSNFLVVDASIGSVHVVIWRLARAFRVVGRFTVFCVLRLV